MISRANYGSGLLTVSYFLAHGRDGSTIFTLNGESVKLEFRELYDNTAVLSVIELQSWFSCEIRS
jgi:hypothetical protein